jgi:hypothetical protein
MVRAYALALCAVLVAAGHIAQPALAQPAVSQTSSPASPSPDPAAVEAANALIGTYTAGRMMDEGMQRITLRLRPDRIATLRTETPSGAQGATAPPFKATYETGSWYDKDGHAVVRFDTTSTIANQVPTEQKKDSLELTFVLSGCALKLIGDPEKRYGASGLTFAKQGCT